MDFSSVPLDLWSEVIAVGHRVLRDLDDDEVPAGIRRVAASDRLPPPLARALLRELDQNDWLREKVAETWQGNESSLDTHAEQAASLFFDRPEGWELEVAGLIASEEDKDQLAELERLRTESERLEAELQVARSRAKAAEKRARQAEKESTAQTKAQKADAKRALQEGSGREADLGSKLEQATRDLDRLGEELRAAHDRSRILKSELLRARRAAMPQESEAPDNAWSVREPMALAKHLDQLAEAAVAPTAVPGLRGEAPEAEPPPKGVRPDDPSMVEWLLSRTTPSTFLVDGYNVTYQLDPADFHTGELRDLLNRALARLRQAASGPMRVVVIYDSDQGSDESFSGPGGIEVRFTDRGVLADDVILDLASRLEGRVIAVSSDRFVRESAETKGAHGLWSQALAGWISR